MSDFLNSIEKWKHPDQTTRFDRRRAGRCAGTGENCNADQPHGQVCRARSLLGGSCKVHASRTIEERPCPVPLCEVTPRWRQFRRRSRSRRSCTHGDRNGQRSTRQETVSVTPRRRRWQRSTSATDVPNTAGNLVMRRKDGWYAKNGQPPSGTGKGKSGQGGQGKGKGKNKDDKAQHEEILSPQQALRRTLLCTRCGNGGTRKGSWRSLHPVCGRPHRQ